MFNSKMLRSSLAVFAACCSVLLGAAACTRTAGDDAATATNSDANATKQNAVTPADRKPAEKKTAPLPAAIADSKIKSLDGDEFRLADYKGKVVVLDLWATWCGPCRAEIPFLIELGNEYKERGVEIIGITTDLRTTPDEKKAEALVQDFKSELNINYKIGWTNKELDQLIIFGGNSIPQTIVISRDGTIISHHAGFSVRAGTDRKIREAVEQALARG